VSRHRDALSRVTRIVFPDGREARLDYAPWQTTVTDPEDADPGSANSATPTLYRFDFARNVVEVTTTVKNGSGAGISAVATTRYGYDAADRLVQIVDARGSTTDLVLDARGDVLRLRHPDAGDTLRLVDAHRRRIYQHDAAGNEWWYGYDALGRPTDEVPGPDPGGPPAVTRGYDGTGTGSSVGRLTRAEVVPDGVVTAYTYNGRGQVESVTRTIGGATVTSDTMAYDDLGGISRQTFKGGAALDWSRGRDGLLVSVHLRRPDGSVVPMVDGVTYHPSGRVAAAQIGQGKVTFGASFDAGTHRLASRGYVDQAGAPLYRLSKLSYDGAGNIRGYDEDAKTSVSVRCYLE
jgi:YD repeat-containing protein